MAKKKAVKAARAAPKASRAAATVRAPKTINVSMAAKGDLSLPSAKSDKKKLLFVGAAIIILLAIAYYFMSGTASAGELWPN